jgi:uncharacterized glyoxalase superfamily protein PhnB
MSTKESKPTFASRLAYKDQRAALEWLERAFGFEPTVVATDGEGKVVHAEMRFGNGLIFVGSEWGEIRSPASLGGTTTQTIKVEVENGLDAHCERARAAGGVILDEPKDQFHGDRTYRVMDPERHIWSFSQHLRDASIEEMESAVPGMKIWLRDSGA